jgi:hypothetical protein
VIDGGCPCSFGVTGDFGHRLMRHAPGAHVPKQV